MKLLEKLLDIQANIDSFVKDQTIGTGTSSYKAVGSEQVLNVVRPLMIQHKLLLEPSVESATVKEGSTSSGTTRYFTELSMVMTWVDAESGEERPIKWYGQGVDLAGEKGCGKAQTYAEKYFMMKYFHVPTPKDDPDTDTRTAKGEKAIKGTQAAKENTDYFRKALTQMLDELCEKDTEKIKKSVIVFTKNDSRQYAGVDSIDKITEPQLPIVYASISKKYAEKTGKKFELKVEE